jgi:hypothetical protein
MDAEKNVVEAARKLLKLIQPNAVGGFDVTGNLHDELRELMGAIAAYDSAPAPSEDRVREAVEAVEAASLRWVASVGRPDRGERNTRIADSMRPYVTPAPALPPGTVVARLEWLRLMLTVAKQRDCTEIVDEIEGFLAKLPRPEPPKELVRKWELEAEKWAASRFLENPLSARIGYVAALRAAWEADPKGKQ